MDWNAYEGYEIVGYRILRRKLLSNVGKLWRSKANSLNEKAPFRDIGEALRSATTKVDEETRLLEILQPSKLLVHYLHIFTTVPHLRRLRHLLLHQLLYFGLENPAYYFSLYLLPRLKLRRSHPAAADIESFVFRPPHFPALRSHYQYRSIPSPISMEHLESLEVLIIVVYRSYEGKTSCGGREYVVSEIYGFHLFTTGFKRP